MSDGREAVRVPSSPPPARWWSIDEELRRLFGELAVHEMRHESLRRVRELLKERDELLRQMGDRALLERRAAAGPLATPEAIDAFRQEFPRMSLWLVPPVAAVAPGAPVVADTATPTPGERDALRRLMDDLGAPPAFTDAEGAADEIARLRHATRAEGRGAWNALAPARQLQFVEYLAARLRAALDHTPFGAAGRSIIEALRDHLQAGRTGIAHGIARWNTPRGASWHADAARCHRELGALVTPAPSVPAAPAAPQTRRVREPDNDARALPPRPNPFAGWEHLPRFAGKTALILGGGGRHLAEVGETLRRDLGLAELEWIDVDGKLRQLESVVARVLGGAFAFVFLTKFCSHTQSDPLVDACRRADVPYAVLRHGHGAQAVKSAVERAFGNC